MRASRAVHRCVQPFGAAGELVHATVVWGASFGTMGAAALTAGAFSPWLPFAATHRIVGAPAMAFCLRCTGTRMRLFVDPDFSADTVSVYMQNHISLLDAHVASNAIPTPFCGLMNAWQFHIPIYGWLMRQSRGIPVPSTPGQRTRRLAEAARERAAEGLSILTFPEAHRTRDGKPQPHRSGVYRMAQQAGLPIVPIAVHGLFAINRRGQATFNPGTVTVVIGCQRETRGLTEDALQALRTEMEDWTRRIVESGHVPQGYREVVTWPRREKTEESGAPENGVHRQKPSFCSLQRR